LPLIHVFLWWNGVCLLFRGLLSVRSLINFLVFSLGFHVVIVYLQVFRRSLQLVQLIINRILRILVILRWKKLQLWITAAFFRRSCSSGLTPDGFRPQWTTDLRLSDRSLLLCWFILGAYRFVGKPNFLSFVLRLWFLELVDNLLDGLLASLNVLEGRMLLLLYRPPKDYVSLQLALVLVQTQPVTQDVVAQLRKKSHFFALRDFFWLFRTAFLMMLETCRFLEVEKWHFGCKFLVQNVLC